MKARGFCYRWNPEGERWEYWSNLYNGWGPSHCFLGRDNSPLTLNYKVVQWEHTWAEAFDRMGV